MKFVIFLLLSVSMLFAAATSESSSPTPVTPDVAFVKKRLIAVDQAMEWKRQRGHNVNAFPPLSKLMTAEEFDTFTTNAATIYMENQPADAAKIQLLWNVALCSHLKAHAHLPLDTQAIIEAAKGYTNHFFDLSPYTLKDFNRPKVFRFTTHGDSFLMPDRATLQAFLSQLSFESYQQADKTDGDVFFNSIFCPNAYQLVLGCSDSITSRDTISQMPMLLAMIEPVSLIFLGTYFEKVLSS